MNGESSSSSWSTISYSTSYIHHHHIHHDYQLRSKWLERGTIRNEVSSSSSWSTISYSTSYIYQHIFPILIWKCRKIIWTGLFFSPASEYITRCMGSTLQRIYRICSFVKNFDIANLNASVRFWINIHRINIYSSWLSVLAQWLEGGQ